MQPGKSPWSGSGEGNNMTRRPPNSAGPLLDSGPQMRCVSANEGALTLTKKDPIGRDSIPTKTAE
jgi:hypothetical protein